MNSESQSKNSDRPGSESAIDIPVDAPLAGYKAHWHIFVPTAIIACLYICGWVALYFSGMAGGELARLFVVVIAVGVPLLLVHAFLRYQTISIYIYQSHVLYHPGWPASEPVALPFGLIKNARFTRGLSGRLFGGGTVVIVPVAGQPIGVADVANPIDAVGRLMAQKRLASAPK